MLLVLKPFLHRACSIHRGGMFVQWRQPCLTPTTIPRGHHHRHQPRGHRHHHHHHRTLAFASAFVEVCLAARDVKKGRVERRDAEWSGCLVMSSSCVANSRWHLEASSSSSSVVVVSYHHLGSYSRRRRRRDYFQGHFNKMLAVILPFALHFGEAMFGLPFFWLGLVRAVVFNFA